jgi:hypothetical protein
MSAAATQIQTSFVTTCSQYVILTCGPKNVCQRQRLQRIIHTRIDTRVMRLKAVLTLLERLRHDGKRPTESARVRRSRTRSRLALSSHVAIVAQISATNPSFFA